MMQVRVKDVAEMLGGATVLGRAVQDRGALIDLIGSGLPVAALERLSAHLGAGGAKGESLKSVLQVRRRATARLGKAEGERAERVARLFAMAIQAFGDEDTGRQFMLTPHDRLGGKSPLFMCRSELGGREVEGLLNAIAYGLPA
jgi:putative toxin-antitoxin system antitoxin component (TIGR02293 family)